MKEVFKLNESQTYDFRSQNALKVERYNTVRYGKKSLRILGPQIWNSLPNEHKTTTNLDQFKRLMSQRRGPKCSCNICKYIFKWHRCFRLHQIALLTINPYIFFYHSQFLLAAKAIFHTDSKYSSSSSSRYRIH